MFVYISSLRIVCALNVVVDVERRSRIGSRDGGGGGEGGFEEGAAFDVLIHKILEMVCLYSEAKIKPDLQSL